jgi:hypothetical protein
LKTRKEAKQIASKRSQLMWAISSYTTSYYLMKLDVV